jgi:hypothetical protein
VAAQGGHESPAKKKVFNAGSFRKRIFRTLRAGEKACAMVNIFELEKKKYRIKGGTAWLENQIY